MGDTAFKDMAVLRELARYVFSYGAELDRYTAEDLEDSKRLYGAMYLLMSQSQALIDMAERAVSLLGLSARGYRRQTINDPRSFYRKRF